MAAAQGSQSILISRQTGQVLMLLSDEENIREVMAFPKTASGQDPMTASPDQVDQAQLDELHLQVVLRETDDTGEA